MVSLAELIFGGVLERHPDVRAVIMETGASWLLWQLWRMDEMWERYRTDVDYAPPLKPSEYIRRQCFLTVDADEWPIRYLFDAGYGDCLVFTSDYPHHDCAFPEAVNEFLKLDGISNDSKRRVLWDNAQRLLAGRLSALPVAS
jgi:predicted TIM-barrel fold metal-dependent hydrolase